MGNPTNLHFHSSRRDDKTGAKPPSTSPPLDASTHKHYHAHVDARSPTLENTSTETESSSNGIAGSFRDVVASSHHTNVHLPNPFTATVHVVEDHITELKYGHMSRVAKREARRSSQHSEHAWSISADTVREMSVPESDEVAEEWKERDQKLWEAELKKRELARKTCDFSSAQ